MKKLSIILSVVLALLSGCGGPAASKDSCTYCGKKPACLYELNGQEIIFCKDCYKIECERIEQDNLNLKNGIN